MRNVGPSPGFIAPFIFPVFLAYGDWALWRRLPRR
jgi:hypothetical protein